MNEEIHANNVHELKKLIRNSIKTEINSVQFRNKKTGETATQIPIFDMGDWERVGQNKPKPKKPNPATAKFSDMLQYQIDLQNWKQEQAFNL